MTFIVKLIREPIVVFILLGSVLFGAMAAFKPASVGSTIVIRPEAIRAALKNDEDLSGVKPDAARQAKIIQGLIDDEVLLNEAYAMGYDKNDSRVRKRLLGMMRSSMVQKLSDPSVTQLEKYYRENLDQFQTEAAVSFEQILYTFTNEQTPTDPEVFIQQLNDGLNTEGLGDFSMLGQVMPKQARNRIVLLFGREFADIILNAETRRWMGPLQSRHGIHYVKVFEHHPAEQQTYEQVEPYLKQQWMFDQQRAQQQANIESLRKDYKIILPDEYKTADERK